MDNTDEIYFVEKNCFDDPWTREMLESELQNSLSVVVCERRGGEVKGFALGRVVADEAELFKIAVLPDFRRQGIAEEMLTALHEKMKERGARVCFLEVREKNEAAIALYKKAGYEKLRVIPRYYKDDNAVTMSVYL